MDAQKKLEKFTKNRTPKDYMKEAVLNRETCHNLISKDVKKKRVSEYGLRTGKVIARTISALRNNIANSESSHAQQYMLKKGLKIFGQKGKAAAMAELLQQHQRACFEPVWVHKLLPIERKRAMISLMLLMEKRKAR